jgi:tetratricopeptide (TPR) repeat protein
MLSFPMKSRTIIILSLLLLLIAGGGAIWLRQEKRAPVPAAMSMPQSLRDFPLRCTLATQVGSREAAKDRLERVLDQLQLSRALPDLAANLLAQKEIPLLNLALLQFATGKFKEAENAALSVTNSLQRTDEDAFLAFTIAGWSAHWTNQNGRALDHFRSAAALTAEDKDFRQWLAARWAVGVILHQLGRYSDAEAAYAPALEPCEKTLGAESPELLSLCNNLAEALRGQGKFPAAEAEHRAVLERRIKALGAEHEDTLLSRHNLAVALTVSGKLEEAEKEMRETMALRQKVLGPDHADTLATRKNLGSLFGIQGKIKESMAELEEVLAIQQRVLGEEHPDTLASHNNRANTNLAQGHPAEAETELQAVLAVRLRILEADHPDTLSTRNNLANALVAQDKLAAAEEQQRIVTEVRTRLFGAEHPDTLQSRSSLASLLRAEGKAAEAETELRAILAIRERQGRDGIELFDGHYNLALCLAKQGQKEEALQHAQTATDGWLRLLGANDQRTKLAQQFLDKLKEAP